MYIIEKYRNSVAQSVFCNKVVCKNGHSNRKRELANKVLLPNKGPDTDTKVSTDYWITVWISIQYCFRKAYDELV